ncbi:MAG: hypothetical protein IKX28_06210 [Bacteroidales bacterium]|nr:hypothetical protein [Bacteroidales bacterium]
MNKYGDIKTTVQLDKAIRSATAASKKQRKSVEKRFKRFKTHYTPSHLATNLLRRGADTFSWTGVALGVVRGLKMIAAPGSTGAAKH